MAYEFSPAAVKTTLKAGEDLSGKQYHFVKIDNGDGTVKAVSAATDKPIGVLQNDPKAGQAAEVTIVGGTKVVSGGTASPGQVVLTSSSATAVTGALGANQAASAQFVMGTFIESATASAVTTIALTPGGRGA